MTDQTTRNTTKPKKPPNIDTGTSVDLKTRGGKTFVLINEGNVPSASAPVHKKLAFAAAFFKRFMAGDRVSQKTMEKCVAWIEQAANAARAK